MELIQLNVHSINVFKLSTLIRPMELLIEFRVQPSPGFSRQSRET
jgi:hypothetical protein